MERVVNTPAKLLFISAVLLASCGQKTSTPVRIAVQTPSTNNYATHFASWLGFYKEEGLDVTISQIAGASKVLEALVAGSADVGGGVYEQTIQMAAEGKSIVAFLSLTKSPNFAIVAKPGGAVTSIAAMKGHSVGVSSLGSPSQFYLNELLSKAGLSPNDVSTTRATCGGPGLAGRRPASGRPACRCTPCSASRGTEPDHCAGGAAAGQDGPSLATAGQHRPVGTDGGLKSHSCTL